MYTQDQIRGWPKPRVIPAAVTEDKTYKPAKRTGFKKARARYFVNENPDGN
jgi:hypothetical protein